MEKQIKEASSTPIIAPTAFIAKGAVVLGNVTLEADVSIWYNATIRSCEDNIRIGEGSNIQDGAVIHVDKNYQVNIGRQVTVGHGAIVHGCRIDDYTLIGMGAIILNGASIGKNCIIGAGALITQGTAIPDNSLVIGSPARVIRQVTDEEIAASIQNALHYIEEARIYKKLEEGL